MRRKVDAAGLPDAVERHLSVPARLDTGCPADRARFVVFDTEMTGLGPDDRLLSLGAVRIEESRIDLGQSFYEILDPARDIPRDSIVIHHIVPDMTQGQPDAAQILPRFLTFIDADVLVAHNARFDRDYLSREMRRHFGIPLFTPIVDVMWMSRVNARLREKYRLPGALEHHSLDALAAAYGVAIEDRHSAYGDALATGLIFLRLIKALQRFGIYKIKHLLRVAGV